MRALISKVLTLATAFVLGSWLGFTVMLIASPLLFLKLLFLVPLALLGLLLYSKRSIMLEAFAAAGIGCIAGLLLFAYIVLAFAAGLGGPGF